MAIREWLSTRRLFMTISAMVRCPTSAHRTCRSGGRPRRTCPRPDIRSSEPIDATRRPGLKSLFRVTMSAPTRHRGPALVQIVRGPWLPSTNRRKLGGASRKPIRFYGASSAALPHWAERGEREGGGQSGLRLVREPACRPPKHRWGRSKSGARRAGLPQHDPDDLQRVATPMRVAGKDAPATLPWHRLAR